MDILMIMFLWLLCGLWAGSINKGKGHPYATGFILGILFGPIGVIIAAISGKVELRTATCPYCRERIMPGAFICEHCHSKLKEVLWKPNR